jgi:predicted O-methyltransferase YrrM
VTGAASRRLKANDDVAARQGLAAGLIQSLAQSGRRLHLDGTADWSVSPETLAFLAEHVSEASVTLETGAGLSTVLFAALGARHTCVCPDAGETRRIAAFCDSRSISTARVEFLNLLSEDCLPTVEGDELDLVLIDGGHGFPMPIIDWYYSAKRLKIGGVLVLDDTHLWSSSILVDFLNSEAGWAPMGRVGRRTMAFRKVAAFSYKEFCFQPYVVRKSRLRVAAAKALAAWDLLSAGDLAATGRKLRKALGAG